MIKSANDVFNYYNQPLDQRYAKIEAWEIIDSDDKSCAKKIKILEELTLNEIMLRVNKPIGQISTTGDEAHSSTTGYKAHSSTTGYKAHSSTTGDKAHSSTTGYYAHSSTTG